MPFTCGVIFWAIWVRNRVGCVGSGKPSSYKEGVVLSRLRRNRAYPELSRSKAVGKCSIEDEFPLSRTVITSKRGEREIGFLARYRDVALLSCFCLVTRSSTAISTLAAVFTSMNASVSPRCAIRSISPRPALRFLSRIRYPDCTSQASAASSHTISGLCN